MWREEPRNRTLDLCTCVACGRAFVCRPENRSICPDCRVDLDALHQDVKDFLRANPGLAPTASQLADLLGVEEKKIQALVADGRVAEVEEPRHRDRRCQSCGERITGGNLCPQCLAKIHRDALRTPRKEIYTRKRPS